MIEQIVDVTLAIFFFVLYLSVLFIIAFMLIKTWQEDFWSTTERLVYTFLFGSVFLVLVLSPFGSYS